MKFTIKITDILAQSLLARMKYATQDLSPAFKEIGQLIRDSSIKNFKEGGRPTKWKISKRAELQNGQTLMDSGKLKNSITYNAYSNKAIIGTNKPYAAIHQFGGKIPPHAIEPIFKKALYWKGAKHPVKRVMHPGFQMPKRPFLLIQKEDMVEIKDILKRHIIGGEKNAV